MKDRLVKIKEYVDKCGKVSFHELEKEFTGVSSMTLRRDLQRLEEDNKVFRGSGVPNVEPIDAECKFTKEVPDYQGLFVKDADNLFKEVAEEMNNKHGKQARDRFIFVINKFTFKKFIYKIIKIYHYFFLPNIFNHLLCI